VVNVIFPFDPASPVLRSYQCFRALVKSSDDFLAQSALGGKLLYAGELDDEGRAIVIAGNVAGCGTFTATADVSAQRQAIRDGIVDFLVTSLDEALRILKNEVRKHATVAVCVGLAPADIEAEMLERGVQPDLTRESAEPMRAFGDQDISQFENEPMQTPASVAWLVDTSPAKWLPRFDAIALECLDRADVWNRRWIRLSPRYLGRHAPNVRIVCADRQFAASFVERTGKTFDEGELEIEATILVSSSAGFEEHHFPAVARS
jgi:hypothetical protein